MLRVFSFDFLGLLLRGLTTKHHIGFFIRFATKLRADGCWSEIESTNDALFDHVQGATCLASILHFFVDASSMGWCVKERRLIGVRFVLFSDLDEHWSALLWSWAHVTWYSLGNHVKRSWDKWVALFFELGCERTACHRFSFSHISNHWLKLVLGVHKQWTYRHLWSLTPCLSLLYELLVSHLAILFWWYQVIVIQIQ